MRLCKKKANFESRYLSRETRSHSDRPNRAVVGPTRARFGSIAVGSIFPTEISPFLHFFFFKEFLYFLLSTNVLQPCCNYHRRHFSGELLSCSFPEGTSVFNRPYSNAMSLRNCCKVFKEANCSTSEQIDPHVEQTDPPLGAIWSAWANLIRLSSKFDPHVEQMWSASRANLIRMWSNLIACESNWSAWEQFDPHVLEQFDPPLSEHPPNTYFQQKPWSGVPHVSIQNTVRSKRAWWHSGKQLLAPSQNR